MTIALLNDVFNEILDDIISASPRMLSKSSPLLQFGKKHQGWAIVSSTVILFITIISHIVNDVYNAILDNIFKGIKKDIIHGMAWHGMAWHHYYHIKEDKEE